MGVRHKLGVTVDTGSPFRAAFDRLHAMRPLSARLGWTVLCVLLLAGCASQSPYVTPQGSGALNATAQILGDLAFLLR